MAILMSRSTVFQLGPWRCAVMGPTSRLCPGGVPSRGPVRRILPRRGFPGGAKLEVETSQRNAVGDQFTGRRRPAKAPAQPRGTSRVLAGQTPFDSRLPGGRRKRDERAAPRKAAQPPRIYAAETRTTHGADGGAMVRRSTVDRSPQSADNSAGYPAGPGRRAMEESRAGPTSSG